MEAWKPLLATYCAHCKAESAGLKKCGKCRLCHFCGDVCLRAGWKAHKPFCQQAYESAYATNASKLARTAARALLCIDHLGLQLHVVQQGYRRDVQSLVLAYEEGCLFTSDCSLPCACAGPGKRSFTGWNHMVGSEVSLREFIISGLCRHCQDQVFLSEPETIKDDEQTMEAEQFDGVGDASDTGPMIACGVKVCKLPTPEEGDPIKVRAVRTYWINLEHGIPLFVRGEILEVTGFCVVDASGEFANCAGEQRCADAASGYLAKGPGTGAVFFLGQAGRPGKLSVRCWNRYASEGWLQLAFAVCGEMLHGNVSRNVVINFAGFRELSALQKAVMLSRVAGLDLANCAFRGLPSFEEFEAMRRESPGTWVDIWNYLGNTARLKREGYDICSLEGMCRALESQVIALDRD
jgi:hypothetical protein